MTELPVTFQDVLAAANRIKGVVIRTGLTRSVELDRITGGRIWVKPECLQLSGSFKFRGAYNRLVQIDDAGRKNGVVAFSSGNHGQGVALAANMLGMPATIVMPEDAPAIKVARTRSHGAEVVFFDRHSEDREAIAAQISAETGAIVVPSYDDVHIIAGQGTLGIEVAEDLIAMNEKLDAYIVPAGGGGLFAGNNLAFSGLMPDVARYSAEPADYDDHARSFAKGTRQSVAPGVPSSICDAILTSSPGELTFAINSVYAKAGLKASDDDVRRAMTFAFDYLNLVVEPGGAIALACVLNGSIDCRGKNVAVLLSGGNVDRDFMCETLQRNPK